MKLTYGAVGFLLTADIMEATERELAASSADLRSRVMLVPHHGAPGSSSSAFIDKVKPYIAVVSCGYNNNFGFPNPRVCARYHDRGIQLLRTDLDGAVTIVTDGRKIERVCHGALKNNRASSH